jgi:hypothetical protein
MEYKPLGLTIKPASETKLFGVKPVLAPQPVTKEAPAAKLPHHTQEENKVRAILEAPIQGNVWEVVCPAGSYPVTRYRGEDEKEARTIYKTFVEKSKAGYGEVGHERVNLIHDGLVLDTYMWEKVEK